MVMLAGISLTFTVVLAILWVPACRGLTLTDVSELQKLVSRNLTDAFGELADDVLRTQEIAKVLAPQYGSTQELTSGDVESILSSLVNGVEEQFKEVKLAMENVKSKLLSYLTQPRPTMPSQPRLVTPCCKGYGYVPGSLQYSPKLGLMVCTQHECCARNLETFSDGCNLRADEALDAMKNNFANVPSILWQEIGTSDGQHVQYPRANRSCDTSGHSISLLLRESYRARMSQPGELRLVIVLDAGDEMMNQVQPTSHAATNFTHWDMVQKAAVDILGSIPAKDKVSIVTTGGENFKHSQCNSSLLINTRENLQTMRNHIIRTTPKGDPDYIEAFRQAFSLLKNQENIDKTMNQTEDFINVIVFLTNSDTAIGVLKEAPLLQEVADGQFSLLQPAHIAVYSILQLHGGQAAFKLFLKLADQNNQKLQAFNGAGNETAQSWIAEGFHQPVGPPGYFRSVPDTRLFAFSEDVLQFFKNLNITSSRLAANDMVLDLVSLKSKEGLTLHTVLSLRNSTSTVALLAANLSVDALLGGVRAFRHQTLSYAYVVERGTGHVLLHPRLRIYNESTPRYVALPELWETEPDLRREQRTAILSSGSSTGQFKAKLTYSRKTSRSTIQDATIFHRRVSQTNFIIVLVIFDSEKTKSSLPAQQVTRSNSAAHHRFYQLNPPRTPVCLRSNHIVLENKMGIKFSPDCFVDRTSYVNQGLGQQQIEDLDNFIKLPTTVPNILSFGNVSKVVNTYMADLVAVTSPKLLEIWNSTRTTPTYRLIGMVSGILGTLPATALDYNMGLRDYQWFTSGLESKNRTVVTVENFPGSTPQVFISKSLDVVGNSVGVVTASVPSQAMKSLLYNKVEKCRNGSFTCVVIDLYGYVLNINEFPLTSNHITQSHPWIANQLFTTGIMKPVWCTDLFYKHNRLSYLINAPASGVSYVPNTSGSPIDNCKTFSLHPIGQSNLLVLVTHAHCPPDIFKCALGMPPLAGRSPIKSCSNCHNGTSELQGCQQLCQCSSEIVSCPDDPRASPFATHDNCQGRLEKLVPLDVRPSSPPPPSVKACQKTCSEMSTQSECKLIVDCLWDISQVYPTCVHLVSQTTTTSMTSATTASTNGAPSTPAVSRTNATGTGQNLLSTTTPASTTDTSTVSTTKAASTFSSLAATSTAGFKTSTGSKTIGLSSLNNFTATVSGPVEKNGTLDGQLSNKGNNLVRDVTIASAVISFVGLIGAFTYVIFLKFVKTNAVIPSESTSATKVDQNIGDNSNENATKDDNDNDGGIADGTSETKPTNDAPSVTLTQVQPVK